MDNFVRKDHLDLNHTTNSQSIIVHYRFHPLHGKSFRPLLFKRGPFPHYVIQPQECRKIFIPEWMVDPLAADLKLCAAPIIGLGHLLDLSLLLEKLLASLSDDGSFDPIFITKKRDRVCHAPPESATASACATAGAARRKNDTSSSTELSRSAQSSGRRRSSRRQRRQPRSTSRPQGGRR